MPRQRRSTLLDTLQTCSVDVLAACDWEEARRILGVLSPNVVLTDADGDWRTVLAHVRQTGRSIEVIVCARLLEPTLWREIRDGGAYDVLVEPYRAEEIKQIVGHAAALAYMRSLRMPAVPQRAPRQAAWPHILFAGFWWQRD